MTFSGNLSILLYFFNKIFVSLQQAKEREKGVAATGAQVRITSQELN